MMNRNDWDRAYPPTPTEYHNVMMDTLDHLPEKSRRRRMGMALVVAAVMVMMMAAAAFAVTKSGLLERWFPNGVAPERTQELLMQPSDSVTQDGITLTLDEYIRDSDLLTIHWSVKSSRDDAVTFIGGAPVLGDGFGYTGSSGFAATWWEMEGMDILGGERPARAEAIASYEVSQQAADKPVDAVFRVAVYPLGETPNTAQPLTELVLTATLSPGESGSASDGHETSYEFDDHTLTIDRLDFSGASTVFEWTLVTKQSAVSGEPNDLLVQRDYLLLDADGNDLMRDCEGLGAYDGVERETLPDGRMQLHHAQKWSPLANVPDKVTLMPYAQSQIQRHIDEGLSYERAIEACYIPGDAVTLSITNP